MLGIFLDVETNGINPFIHKIIEIAFKIIDLSDGSEFYRYAAYVLIPKKIWKKSSPESLEVNGITYGKLLLKGKKEKIIKREIIDTFKKFYINRKNSIFICQNPSFDRIFFSKIIDPQIQEKFLWPYHWLDFASMYFALLIKKTNTIEDKIYISKDKIAEELSLPKEKKPHRALNGVNHLLLCYEKLIGFPKK
ncbi:MAG: hypothetical protein AMS24_00870 [Chlamydiae bacterium SM23_39]|nr:MAG: hypothetical protein AMS24_00870 [Chlamydiae bacterium SM23_39]